MKKYINLSGKIFEVVSPRFNLDYENIKETTKTRNIFNAYENPSQAKCNIYDDWDLWFWRLYDNEIIEDGSWLGVRSKNTFMFTLHFLVTYEGEKYYCVVTPSNQTAYKCNC